MFLCLFLSPWSIKKCGEFPCECDGTERNHRFNSEQMLVVSDSCFVGFCCWMTTVKRETQKSYTLLLCQMDSNPYKASNQTQLWKYDSVSLLGDLKSDKWNDICAMCVRTASNRKKCIGVDGFGVQIGLARKQLEIRQINLSKWLKWHDWVDRWASMKIASMEPHNA